MIKFLAVSVFSLISINAHADFSGKVWSVTDGDTVTVLVNNQKTQVRLENIDAPEISHPKSQIPTQPFGQQSRKLLNDLVYGKSVYVKSNKMDLYKRHIGTIYIDQRNINLIMVQNGLAWASREYLNDNSYINAENYAKKFNLGLWSDKRSIYPAQWRKLYK